MLLRQSPPLGLSEAPKLALPQVLEGIWQPRRYKVMHGGRGGGKSWSVAGVLLVMAAQRPLRILCAREIQKSIAQSVHQLLKDQIVRLGLQAFYEVLETEIRGINGSLFLFSGLQSHTVDSIKSFEGCDIVWVEEAHGVSKKSWDVLTPTIRKEGSEIWLTLNPDMETDETYQRFIATPSPDTWVCQINWRDNPWFPEVLMQERLKAKRSMLKEDYEHIWEGRARRVSAGAIYRLEMEAIYEDERVRDVPYDPTLPVHTVWDLGWNDAMTIIMVQRGPLDVRIIDYIEDSHRTLDWYVEQLEKRPYRWGSDYLPHDGKTRNFQTGKSTEDLLRDLGRVSVESQPVASSVEEGIKQVRMLFPRCYFDRRKTARLLECLKRYQRQVHSKTNEPMGPLHDQYSHGADAFRYLAQWVPHMRGSKPPKPEKSWRDRLLKGHGTNKGSAQAA
ncbi:PBSX family phage terminase large subunit [Comamonas aquatica]|nr:PBSX family phage terminase large subunit [Comamonas aquatica]